MEIVQIFVIFASTAAQVHVRVIRVNIVQLGRVQQCVTPLIMDFPDRRTEFLVA